MPSKYTPLIDGAKELIYSLIHDRTAGAAELKPTSIRIYFQWLLYLVKWMADEGTPSFSQLDAAALSKYLLGVEALAFCPRHKMAAIRVVRLLYEQRAVLHDGIGTEPWPEGDPERLIKPTGSPDNQTEALPLEVAMQLFGAALDTVENAGETLGLWLRTQRLKRIDRETRAREGVRATALVREHGRRGQRDLAEEITRLAAACMILILGFSGMRISELINLPRRPCRTSVRGGEELLWICGSTFKLEKDARAHQWMVPPIVFRAVKILRILSNRSCRQLRDEETGLLLALAERSISKKVSDALGRRLTEVRGQKDLLLLRPDDRHGQSKEAGAGSIVQGTAVARIKTFADFHAVVGDDGEAWDLAPHQLRRTFAKFVSASTMGDLRFLRQQFGHWTLEMTAYYANGGQADQELVQWINDARVEYRNELVEGWLEPDAKLAGGAGARIMAARERTAFVDAKDKRTLARALADGVHLRGTGHSWCMAAGNGCGGRGLFDATLCASCGDGVIDRRHGPFWRGLAAQQREILAEAGEDLGLPSRARTERLLSTAERVLETN